MKSNELAEEVAVDGFDSAAFTRNALSSWQNLASLVDHTILKADATRGAVVKVCEEAAAYHFACAMVNPWWVALAHSILAGSGAKVGTVVGFPLGASLSVTKREETAELVKLGAHDIDMVINIGLLKSGQNALVEQDRKSVV